MITKQEVIVVKLVHDHDRIMYRTGNNIRMIDTVTSPLLSKMVTVIVRIMNSCSSL